MRRSGSSSSKGFSLLEMAVVLIIAGLMIGMVNRTQNSGVTATGNQDATSCYAQTQKQLQVINDAMRTFRDKNERLPIPAGRSVGVNSTKSGAETVLASDLANIDRVGALLFGALPYQALGLSDYYAADCWGNKFTYVVTEKMTTNATSGGYKDSSVAGGITINLNGGTAFADAAASPSTGMAYAVISHGETGVGAVKKNYSGASHGWCSVAVARDTQNCDISNNVLTTATFNNSPSAGAAFYDDLIIFGGKKNSPQVAPPAIYAWGANYGQGRIGDGGTAHRLRPVLVTLPGGAMPASVYAGVAQSCALDTQGNGYCWGLNGDGNGGTTGNNVPPNSSSPVTYLTPQAMVMPTGVKFTKMALGHRHNCALADNGKAYCWGDNQSAQRGDGVMNLSWNKPTDPVTMPVGVKFVDLVSRDDVNCALGDDGKAYCWGSGTYWRQVEGSNNNSSSTPRAVVMPVGVSFTSIVGGYTAMCGLGNDSKLYCWGTNIHHQLGNNNAGNSAPALSFDGPVKKTISGFALTCGILTNNQTWCFGDDNNTFSGSGMYPTQFAMPGGVSYFQDMAIGGNSRCGIGNDNMVYCQGKNDVGQLGDGTNNDNMGGWSKTDFSSSGISNVRQIAAYEGHYVALVDAASGPTPGPVKCWGWGYPTIPGNFISISMGLHHTCLLTATGDAQCRADNSAVGNNYGQAANATGPFTQIVTGEYHTCALTSGGNVQCWGYNAHSQAPSTRPGPYTKLTAGGYFTCGLKPDQTVDCWGNLAIGSTGNNIKEISGGYSAGGHLCVLRNDGTVNCFGNNWYNQAPASVSGPFIGLSTHDTYTCAIKANGDAQCWGDNSYNQAPSLISGPFVSVKTAKEHACAIKANGDAQCWGSEANWPYSAPANVTGKFFEIGITEGGQYSCGLTSP